MMNPQNKASKRTRTKHDSKQAGQGSFWRGALCVFAVALAIRLLHIWLLQRAPFFSLLMGDSKSYDVWAQKIAAGDWLGTEVFNQAPLYPYFLGVLYTLFGRDFLLVRICQGLIG